MRLSSSNTRFHRDPHSLRRRFGDTEVVLVFDPEEVVFDPEEVVFDPEEDVLDPEEDVLDPEEDVLDPEDVVVVDGERASVTADAIRLTV